jgi:hypothetical protein
MENTRMCSFVSPDFFAAVQSFASKYGESKSKEDVAKAPEWGVNAAKVNEPQEPKLVQWQRESQSKSPPQRRGSCTPDRSRAKKQIALEKPRTSRQFKFGVTTDETKSAAKIVEAAKTPEEDSNIKMSSIDNWKMTIPSTSFGDSEEWARLRDAQVRFEPDRIVVEAHGRSGTTKIIHCSNIPRRLDPEASTYKLDPDGRDVQINLQFSKITCGKGDNIGDKLVEPKSEKKIGGISSVSEFL